MSNHCTLTLVKVIQRMPFHRPKCQSFGLHYQQIIVLTQKQGSQSHLIRNSHGGERCWFDNLYYPSNLSVVFTVLFVVITHCSTSRFILLSTSYYFEYCHVFLRTDTPTPFPYPASNILFQINKHEKLLINLSNAQTPYARKPDTLIHNKLALARIAWV